MVLIGRICILHLCYLLLCGFCFRRCLLGSLCAHIGVLQAGHIEVTVHLRVIGARAHNLAEIDARGLLHRLKELAHDNGDIRRKLRHAVLVAAAAADDRNLINLRERLRNLTCNVRKHFDEHLRHCGIVVLLVSLGLLFHGLSFRKTHSSSRLCLCLTAESDTACLRLVLRANTACLLLRGVLCSLCDSLSRLCLALLLVLSRLRLSLALCELCSCRLLHAVLLGIRLLVDFGVECLLHDRNFLFLQLGVALCLCNRGINRRNLNILLLCLLLNLVSGIRLCLLRIGNDLQFRLANREFVVLLRNLGVRLYARIVCGLVCLGLRNCDIAVRLRLRNRGILLDLRRVVRTEVVDEPLLIRHVLDVAGENLDAELLHIGSRLHHHLIREGIAVRVDVL